MKLVKTKPDISLAKKTGHFNLLTTHERDMTVPVFLRAGQILLPPEPL
jgi:hypothetical protein